MSASPWITDSPCATQEFTPAWLSSMPRASTPALLGEDAKQRAVAAADIEHARAGCDHLGDEQQIDTFRVGRADGVEGTLRFTATILRVRNAALQRRRAQEAANRVEQLGLVQQEGVVALVRS